MIKPLLCCFVVLVACVPSACSGGIEIPGHDETMQQTEDRSPAVDAAEQWDWRPSADACPETDGPTPCCEGPAWNRRCSDVPLDWDECRAQHLPDGTPCTVSIGPAVACNNGRCGYRRCMNGACWDVPGGGACRSTYDCASP